MAPAEAETATGTVISVEGLTVRFGARIAVDDLNLAVEAQTIHALVGPNGAGKTTAFDCVVGLRAPTGGRVRVFGDDPVRHRRRVHRQMGVVLQDNSLYKRIGVAEAVQLFASFMPAPRPVEEVLADLQLEDRAGDRYQNLSGGQRRRESFAPGWSATSGASSSGTTRSDSARSRSVTARCGSTALVAAPASETTSR